MRQLTIAVLLVVVIALQSALRAVWQPLAYVDLVLILVVYFALQRDHCKPSSSVGGRLANGHPQRPRLLVRWFFKVRLLSCLLVPLGSADTTIFRFRSSRMQSVDNLCLRRIHRRLTETPMPFIQSLSYNLIATTGAVPFCFMLIFFLSGRRGARNSRCRRVLAVNGLLRRKRSR